MAQDPTLAAVAVRCVIAFTGAPLLVRVAPSAAIPSPRSLRMDPTANATSSDCAAAMVHSVTRQSTRSEPGPATVKDLVAAASKQLFGSATAINVMDSTSYSALSESAALVPYVAEAGVWDATSEGPDDVSTPTVFLFFDAKLLTKLGGDTPPSGGERPLTQWIRRQAVTFRMLSTPLTAYWDRLCVDKDHLDAELTRTAQGMTDFDAQFPALLERLAAVPQLQDPSRSLADAADLDKRLKIARETLASISTSTDSRQRGVEAARNQLSLLLSECKNRQAELSEQAQASPALADLLCVWRETVARLSSKWQEVKSFLRLVEEQRKLVQKDRQQLKIVQTGVLSRLDMLTSLPEAYRVATELALERLTLFIAIKRIHSVLSVEREDLQQRVSQFIAQWGRRFPSNLFPAINAPVSIGEPPLDVLASNLELLALDRDTDSASVLLERLGLAGTGQPFSSRRPSPAATLSSQEFAQQLAEQTAQLSAEVAERSQAESHWQSQLAQANDALRELQSVNTALREEVSRGSFERGQSEARAVALETRSAEEARKRQELAARTAVDVAAAADAGRTLAEGWCAARASALLDALSEAIGHSAEEATLRHEEADQTVQHLQEELQTSQMLQGEFREKAEELETLVKGLQAVVEKEPVQSLDGLLHSVLPFTYTRGMLVHHHKHWTLISSRDSPVAALTQNLPRGSTITLQVLCAECADPASHIVEVLLAKVKAS